MHLYRFRVNAKKNLKLILMRKIAVLRIGTRESE